MMSIQMRMIHAIETPKNVQSAVLSQDNGRHCRPAALGFTRERLAAMEYLTVGRNIYENKNVHLVLLDRALVSPPGSKLLYLQVDDEVDWMKMKIK